MSVWSSDGAGGRGGLATRRGVGRCLSHIQKRRRHTVLGAAGQLLITINSVVRDCSCLAVATSARRSRREFRVMRASALFAVSTGAKWNNGIWQIKPSTKPTSADRKPMRRPGVRNRAQIEVESIVADVEDVPLGMFSDVDLCLGCLDALHRDRFW